MEGKARTFVEPHYRAGRRVEGYWREVGEGGEPWEGWMPGANPRFSGWFFGEDEEFVYMDNNPYVETRDGRAGVAWKGLWFPERDEWKFWVESRNGPYHEDMLKKLDRMEEAKEEGVLKLTGRGLRHGDVLSSQGPIPDSIYMNLENVVTAAKMRLRRHRDMIETAEMFAYGKSAKKGREWVGPHLRDGVPVAGYWREVDHEPHVPRTHEELLDAIEDRFGPFMYHGGPGGEGYVEGTTRSFLEHGVVLGETYRVGGSIYLTTSAEAARQFAGANDTDHPGPVFRVRVRDLDPTKMRGDEWLLLPDERYPDWEYADWDMNFPSEGFDQIADVWRSLTSSPERGQIAYVAPIPPEDLELVDPDKPKSAKDVVEFTVPLEEFEEHEHPRDDRGRFTDKPWKYALPPPSLADAGGDKDVWDIALHRWFDETFPTHMSRDDPEPAAPYTFDLEGIDTELLYHVGTSLHRFGMDFPWVIDGTGSPFYLEGFHNPPKVAAGEGSRPAFAGIKMEPLRKGAFASYDVEDDGEISLNSLWWKPLAKKGFLENMAKSEEVGWLAKGTGTPEGIMNHELGHALTAYMAKHHRDLWEWLEDERYFGSVSDYARLNFLEFFAETFSSVLANPNPEEWGYEQRMVASVVREMQRREAVNEELGEKSVWVNPYTRADGTRVSGHWRGRSPDFEIPFSETWNDNVAQQVNAVARLYAMQLGMQPDVWKRKAQESLEKVMADKTVSVRHPMDAALAILRDGRMKNQHETDESNGHFEPDLRVDFEETVLGVPRDTPSEHRPIYGYVQGSNEWGLGQYGDVVFHLKPEVSARSTFLFGDSLDRNRGGVMASVAAAPMLEPNLNAAGAINIVGMERLDQYEDFIEAQVYGQVTLRDIDSIEVLRDRIEDGEDEDYDYWRDVEDEDLLTAAHERGIPVRWANTPWEDPQ